MSGARDAGFVLGPGPWVSAVGCRARLRRPRRARSGAEAGQARPADEAGLRRRDRQRFLPGWEAYSYNDQVKAYNVLVASYSTAANAYVGKLNAFVTASAAYAKCEADSLR